ncbi:hypothetical protein CFOL_v3_08327 [Cephalotus follicularis]|uniref:Reverse transcriptase domain-containing protein n=1 Tax=Cephalotus follicularis TaxID=3775 RepID=A0A1Q3BAI8_CEPFO|nr:hypothetical protein CFOL_v3_08327 [Cephalotus follicularis]
MKQEILIQNFEQINSLKNSIINNLCSDLLNAFWHRKRHVVSLPYEKDFSEQNILIKARPIQMTYELIHELLIRPSKSPWNCTVFYVNLGTPRLVINYKPLNTALQCIRHHILNKKYLLKRLTETKIFLKFDLKSGFWQLHIQENYRYKTDFTTLFEHYEWNIMTFDPSEFQKIMNDNFNPFSNIYIDDI